MSDAAIAVIASCITGALSLAGVIVTAIMGNRKITSKMEVQQAVTDTKLTNLTEEVRAHNNFAQRIPVIEERQANHERRIETLEKERRNPA
jgi:hypothetical protein